MSDASDYKRAYEMQKKARAIAEQRLEDKSRELYTKNKSLEQALETLSKQQEIIIAQEKLASIGQLAAGLAHELNNPNAFIQNNLVTLSEYVSQLVGGLECSFSNLRELDRLRSDSKKDIEKTIVDIEKASDIKFIKSDLSDIIDESLKGSKRIENIANSLRYFANPDISSLKQVDLNECIQQSKRLISNQLIGSIDIQLKLQDLPNITGTPLLLSQAVSNILTNAIEAEPKSGTILVTSKSLDDKIIITIKDDGKGIPSSEISKVFQPFSSPETSKNGLGLNIAQNIIHQHKGHISLKSKEGEGTIVTIELPLNKA